MSGRRVCATRNFTTRPTKQPVQQYHELARAALFFVDVAAAAAAAAPAAAAKPPTDTRTTEQILADLHRNSKR